MLLIVRGAGHTGDDSEDGAEPVINAIDSIGHPAAAAPMPAFAFQNGVENGFWTRWRSHRLQNARMRFLFERACSQEFPYVGLTCEGTIPLLTEFPLVFFLSRFHAANGDLSTERASKPTFKPSPSSVC